MERGDEVPTPARRRTSRFAVTASVLGAVLIGALAITQLRSGGVTAGGSFVASYAAEREAVGSAAPDFEVPDLAGAGTRSLSQLRGHVSVINFWASWCTPCREEAPDLERTYRDYRTRAVEFLGIDERDDSAGALGFVREFNITYPSGSDPSGKLAFD